MKQKILITIDWFDPAFKAGGPIRSCLNMINSLREFYDFYVYSSQYDLGKKVSLIGVTTDQWIDHTIGAKVWYSSQEKNSIEEFTLIINEIRPSTIYLNSVFSKRYTIDVIFVVFWTKFSGKLILATRGMLKPSALKVKSYKKYLFLLLARIGFVTHRILFHASNEVEGSEIRAQFKHANISVIPNLPIPVFQNITPLIKIAGKIGILFIGRIHPIKNLIFAIKQLSEIEGEVAFNVVGSIEDSKYWAECLNYISQLPINVKVEWLGEIPPIKITEIIAKHHLLFLPTKGENYGHAIVETLCIGRPVLISDNTPWKNLSTRMAGWDFSLDHPERFVEALTIAVNWNQFDFDVYCKNAIKFSEEFIQDENLINKYQKLFN